MAFFPNETSFWETPLRIKEIAGDRRANGVSGPNPAADFTSVLFFPAPKEKFPNLSGRFAYYFFGGVFAAPEADFS